MSEGAGTRAGAADGGAEVEEEGARVGGVVEEGAVVSGPLALALEK